MTFTGLRFNAIINSKDQVHIASQEGCLIEQLEVFLDRVKDNLISGLVHFGTL
jgi:hypothetical protein